MTAFYQILDWDTEQLGIVTARITPAVADSATLETCLAQARAANVQLLYGSFPANQTDCQQLAQRYQGALVDHKITYTRNLRAKEHNMPPVPLPLACYRALPAESALEELAYASGQYSRFRCDPRVTEAQFHTLYRAWLENSIKRIIADTVLVIYCESQLAGMVTVGEKNARGDIGLLAVAERYRGQGIGQQLLNAAFRHFQEKGYDTVQVVTQQANLPACRLYERCGFQVEKRECFYHFWLTEDK